MIPSIFSSPGLSITGPQGNGHNHVELPQCMYVGVLDLNGPFEVAHVPAEHQVVQGERTNPPAHLPKQLTHQPIVRTVTPQFTMDEVQLEQQHENIMDTFSSSSS